MPSFIESLPPDLYDTTTLVSLASTLAILGAAYTLSLWALDRTTTSGTTRFLFIWHAFDALLHFTLEGSFLYHCFFSWVNIADVADPSSLAPSPHNFLGHKGRVYGPQAGGDNPFAMLWMVYANADWRWAGADLTIISLELLTVFLAGPLACLICYGLAKRDPRTSILIIIVATMELYGGFLTFCPEWLTGNAYLDSSNWMYLWLYLVFFNMLWVFIPIYVLGVASLDIMDAFKVRAEARGGRKTQ